MKNNIIAKIKEEKNEILEKNKKEYEEQIKNKSGEE